MKIASMLFIAARVMAGVMLVGFLSITHVVGQEKESAAPVIPPVTLAENSADVKPEDKIIQDYKAQDMEIKVLLRTIAAASGLQLIVSNDVTKKTSVELPSIRAIDAINRIANSEGYIVEKQGDTYIVKAPDNQTYRPASRKSVIPLEGKGTFRVDFEDVEVRAAISELARQAGISVSFSGELLIISKTGAAVDPGATPPGGAGNGANVDKVVQTRIERPVTYFHPDVVAEDAIFQIAKDAGLVPSRKVDAEGRLLQIVISVPEMEEPGEAAMSVENFTDLPEPYLSATAKSIEKMLSPKGSVASAAELEILSVRDVPSRMEEIKAFVKLAQDKAKAEYAKGTQKVVEEKLEILKYSTMREVEADAFQAGIKSILTEKGKISFNTDNNSIIIIDVESNVKNIERFMAMYDATPSQIRIEITVAEIGLQESESLGMNVLWQLVSSHGAEEVVLGTGTGFSSLGIPAGATAASVGFNNPGSAFDAETGRFSHGGLSYALDFLRTKNRLNSRAAPAMITADGKKASMKVGEEIPYLQSQSASGGTTTGTVSFKDVAIEVEVTPRILADGLIRLDVKLTAKEQTDTVTIEGNATPVLSNRSIESFVFIKDGETFVLGGLLSDKEREQNREIPGLSDIPLLGAAFRAKSTQRTKTDLMVFLRPKIVGEKKGDYLPAKNSRRTVLMRETRAVAQKPTRFITLIPGARASDVITGSSTPVPAHLLPADDK